MRHNLKTLVIILATPILTYICRFLLQGRNLFASSLSLWASILSKALSALTWHVLTRNASNCILEIDKDRALINKGSAQNIHFPDGRCYLYHADEDRREYSADGCGFDYDTR